VHSPAAAGEVAVRHALAFLAVLVVQAVRDIARSTHGKFIWRN
jgi:hypothetical protein